MNPSDRVIELPAPAKLNLFLRIVGRRADGYHSLQTVFQFVDLADRVRIARRSDTRLRRTADIHGVAESDDLVIRAARLLRDEFGANSGADIGVEKRIPLGGGLGGGSSDAATTLVGLNRLWEIGAEINHLEKLALQLGADVPVFVRGHAAWAEGVGACLHPIALEEPWYVLILLPFAVPTVDVFRASALTRNSPRLRMDRVVRGHEGATDSPVPIERLLAATRNDCESVVNDMYPPVGAALRWLGQHAPARMTGTGATVFAPFDTHEKAVEVAGEIPEPWKGLVTKGLNRSPLLDRLSPVAAPASSPPPSVHPGDHPGVHHGV